MEQFKNMFGFSCCFSREPARDSLFSNSIVKKDRTSYEKKEELKQNQRDLLDSDKEEPTPPTFHNSKELKKKKKWNKKQQPRQSSETPGFGETPGGPSLEDLEHFEHEYFKESMKIFELILMD